MGNILFLIYQEDLIERLKLKIQSLTEDKEVIEVDEIRNDELGTKVGVVFILTVPDSYHYLMAYHMSYPKSWPKSYLMSYLVSYPKLYLISYPVSYPKLYLISYPMSHPSYTSNQISCFMSCLKSLAHCS